MNTQPEPRREQWPNALAHGMLAALLLLVYLFAGLLGGAQSRLAFDADAAAPLLRPDVPLFTDDQVTQIDAAADALPPTSQES